jgi:hypothetical protein
MSFYFISIFVKVDLLQAGITKIQYTLGLCTVKMIQRGVIPVHSITNDVFLQLPWSVVPELHTAGIYTSKYG